MKKLSKFIQFVLLVLCTQCVVHGEISNLRLCADAKCKTIISKAKTELRYNAIDKYMVSFPANKEVRIMSYEDGDNLDLWGIDFQGQVGYAPKRLLREISISVPREKVTFRVPTEPYMQAAVEEEPQPISTEEVPVEDVDTKLSDESIEKSEPNVANVEVDREDLEFTSQQNGVINSETETNELNAVEDTRQSNDVPVEGGDLHRDIRQVDAVDEQDDENDDETDADEYANRQLAKEPLFIKKHAYQTGEDMSQQNHEDDQHVRLEIIGSESIGKTEKDLANDHKEIVDNKNDAKISEENDGIDIVKIQTDSTEPLNHVNNVPEVEQKSNASEQPHEMPSIEDHVESPQIENNKPDLPPVGSYAHIVSHGVSALESESTILNQENLDAAVTKEAFEKHVNPENVTEPEIEKNAANSDNEQDPKIETSDLPTDQKNETSQMLQFNDLINENLTQSSFVELSNAEQDNEFVKNVAQTEPTPLPYTASDSSPILSDEINKIDDLSPKTEYAGSNENNIAIEEIHADHPGIAKTQTEGVGSVVEVNYNENQVINDKPEIIPTTDIPSPNDDIPSPSNVWDEIVTEPTVDIFTQDLKPAESVASNEKSGNWYDDILIALHDTYASVQQVLASTFSSRKDQSESKSQNEHHESVNKHQTDELDGYCERLTDGSCPKEPISIHTHPYEYAQSLLNGKTITYDEFAQEFMRKVVAMADLVVLLTLTATTVLTFTLGHYCLTNNRKEGALISKLNILERKLLTSEKECSLVKADLLETRRKLTSIADKSFGTDDMIKQCESEKQALREQIEALEKELETAAEAGLELNKIVSELLSNQSGSDSIISSVEELQRQLNEQEATTVHINNLLAEKSRDNSELKVLLSGTIDTYTAEIEELMKLNDTLKMDKESVEKQLRENINSLETQLNREVEEKSSELSKLTKKFNSLKAQHEEVTSKWHMCAARAEALEDSIKKLKNVDGKVDLRTIIEATDANAKLIALEKEKEALREKLEGEIDVRHSLEEQVRGINDEITRLRDEFNQAEKDKLEAQTRLDVLSNYFKEKEAQLQKELSVKEALFMKQQGESTSTVERMRNLQDEIQALKSQNDQLRAEIEAQSAAHKAQINAAESRANDSWLAAKQAERRLEESRAEAGVLRRKLTSLTFNPASVDNSLQNHATVDGIIPNDINAPSPIHMESPSSPLNLPLPPNFLPPPPFIPGIPAPGALSSGSIDSGSSRKNRSGKL